MSHIGEPWMWAAFAAVVVVMLAIDLLLLGGGRAHRVTTREAASWSVVWVSVALLFNAALWWYLDGAYGRELANAKATEFLTGYVIEKSLAVDNVFVWLMLFSYFAIPAEYQRRVLIYGVVGAIVMRTIMIFSGSWLISQFHWVLYLFGAFLLLTGAKMLWFAGHEQNLGKNPLLIWMRRHLPLTQELHGEKFWIRDYGRVIFTPLFLVLVLVEISDLIFAVDSIPAIFAITTDPFIVLTSNVFAILGLRAMYFLLAGVADRFVYLKYGLALVLMFIGTKMLIVDFYKIPVGWSLSVVAVLIVASIVLSLIRTRRPQAPELQTEHP
jgi:tellurite resistance protein TerC